MFDAKQYKHDYYIAHKAEAVAYNKEYYARPENQNYFLKYREERREKYRLYAKRRRALIKAGLWTFRDPNKNTKHKNQPHIVALQMRWQAYFDAKKGKQKPP
jgi:hypothetical protein